MYRIYPVKFVNWFMYYLYTKSSQIPCIGYIVTGDWKGERNQHIQLVKVLYC